MASPQQVREYLAHWFQLGKPIVFGHDNSERLPTPIFNQGRYSQAFESCWQQVLDRCGEGCYVKGTTVTVAMMLTASWEIGQCPRCPMPIVMPTMGIKNDLCPCHDIPTWPNSELPAPRLGVDDGAHLANLQTRLRSVRGQDLSAPRQP
ncbi:hypothetical protein C7271_16820 [filamentous cyanobacterium CCP5]|nr:hypothetical protein C7271_16820 [filamentous cyanobacterium CCP5]